MTDSAARKCAYCEKTILNHVGNGPNLATNQIAIVQCEDCRLLDEAGKLNPLGSLQYTSPFAATAALILYFSFLMPIGDCRSSPDHWLVDDHAKIAYAAMLFPPVILWSCAQRYGPQLLLLIGLMLAVYPFGANQFLGDGAQLFAQTRKGFSPATGASFVWLAAASLLVGVWHIFEKGDLYEPNRIKYDRSAVGFIKAYVMSFGLIYLAGLGAGFWQRGDHGLAVQLKAGLWRATLLSFPLAYFFWTVSGIVRSDAPNDTSRNA